MNPWQYSLVASHAFAAACLLLLSAGGRADDIFEDGPGARDVKNTRTPWQEQAAELPPYPASLGKLIELNLTTEGMPYRIYVDPASLTAGKDRVVRFTTVIVSSSGVWNVNYEGLHCGERSFRRYAYGVDGSWRRLPESDWQKISTTGINRYRSFLYENYFCDAGKGYLKADQLVRKLRYVRSPALIED